MNSFGGTNGTDGMVDFQSKAVGLGNAAVDLQNEAVRIQFEAVNFRNEAVRWVAFHDGRKNAP